MFFPFREKGSDASWKNDQEPPPEVYIVCSITFENVHRKHSVQCD